MHYVSAGLSLHGALGQILSERLFENEKFRSAPLVVSKILQNFAKQVGTPPKGAFWAAPQPPKAGTALRDLTSHCNRCESMCI